MTDFNPEWLKTPARTEKYVYLDTSVFYQAAFNFTNSHLGALIQNLHQMGKIIVWNKILREEIRSAVEEKASELQLQVRKFGRYFDGTSSLETLEQAVAGNIVEEKLSDLDNTVFGSRALKLSLDRVSVSKILDDYFAKLPPFDEGKKKAEFPDAIALSALTDWANDTAQNVIVVSADNDFERFCQNQARLEYIKDIKILANELLAVKDETNWIHEMLCIPKNGLTDWIAETVQDHPAEVWDVEGEVTNTKLEDYTIEKIFVWQKEQRECGLIVYNLTFDAELEIYFEYLFSEYESEWPGQDPRDIRPNTIEQWGNRRIIGQIDLQLAVDPNSAEMEIEELAIVSPEVFTINAQHRF